MKVPLSWIKDFVDITLPVEELAHRLTMAGLEVEEVRYVGFPLPEAGTPGRTAAHLRPETKTSGLAWDADKIVVAAVREVLPHPNADRLVLCRLDDGEQEHIVLTGAPNLYPYKGLGPLRKPLKVALRPRGSAHLRWAPARAGAHHPEAGQDPRRRFVLDDLLREGAGHLRRPRRA